MCVFLSDPVQWTADQVIHWAVWVMKEFGIEEMEVGGIHIPGRQLCGFSQEEFLQRVPSGEILWSHLELLRKCKFRKGKIVCVVCVLPQNLLCHNIFSLFSISLMLCADVLASQDQGQEATVTIDQREYQ